MKIERKESATLPTEYGKFNVHVYEDSEIRHHIALVKGKIVDDSEVLVRVHSECLTGDVFRSKKCDCQHQLDKAMKIIAKSGGVIVYLRQEGRGIGLLNKIKAYSLQEKGMDTVQANERLGFKADIRDYSVGVQILADLGIKKVKLLTNNPKKIKGLEKYGIDIVKRVPLLTIPSKENRYYLKTKKDKLGHFLEDKGFVD